MKIIRMVALFLLFLIVIVLWRSPASERREYDVVVVGSDPEAIAAAVAAARGGQTTLLLDGKPVLGGIITRGRLSMLDMSYDPGQLNLLTRGIFEEFFNLNDRRTSLDIAQARRAFETLVSRERNLHVELNAEQIEPVVSDRRIAGITFRSKWRSRTVTAKTFIDASPDADFAYRAGVPFTFGQEDYRGVREPMSATQVFELSGVDWEVVRTSLLQDNDPNTGADEYSAWGFKPMRDYPSRHPDIRLRAPNLGRQSNGNVLVNALQLINVDGTDPSSVEQAKAKAEAEVPFIVAYMRQYPGFENCRLAGIADELYIRETRHMSGMYRLTIDDVMENRDFADKIAFGSYPVDIQKTRHFEDMIIGNPDQYSIPFRSIVPNEIDNLLVSSRSASYDSLAHGSARTVPIGMAVSEAAGTAAAYANTHNLNVHDIAQDPDFRHIRRIQDMLRANHNPLDPIPPYPNVLAVQWSYPAVKFLRHYALIAGGYNNDFQLNNPISRKEFYSLYVQAKALAHVKKNLPLNPDWGKDDAALTIDDVKPFIASTPLSPILLGQLQQAVVQHDTGYMLIYELLLK